MVKTTIVHEAEMQLQRAYEYISYDSPKNAMKVKKDIIAAIKKIKNNPLHHPPDKYKLNNDSTFRAFEIHHYCVSYHARQQEIVILRIRHTSMQPLVY